MDAGLSFVAMMNGDRLGVIGYDVVAKSVVAHEGASGERLRFTLDVGLASRHGFAFDGVLSFAADSMGEVDRCSEQRPQVADRMFGFSQVLPRGFDNVGEALSVGARLAHEFEDQKFTKSQRAKAGQILRKASWLSLLSSRA